MKFIVHSEALLKALAPLLEVINPETSLPVLEHLHVSIEPQDRSVTFKASDLETTLRIKVHVEVGRAGKYCVHAGQFTSLLHQIEPQIVTVLFENDLCHVQGRDFRISLETIAAEDFVIMPEPAPGARVAELHPYVLPLLENATRFARPGDEGTALSGVLLHERRGRLAIAASDGHSLYSTSVALPDGLEGLNVILPVKSLQILCCVNKGEPMLLQADDHHLFLSNGRYRIACRTIQADFPDYEQSIPNATTEFRMVRSELRRTLSLAQCFSLNTQCSLRLEAGTSRSLAVYTAQREGGLSYESHLPVYNFNADIEYRTAIDVDAVLRALDLSDDAYLRFKVTDDPAAAIIIDEHVVLTPEPITEPIEE